jgi:hypothetical protein
MQPVLMQVPPNRPRSITATVMPAPVKRFAKGGPAWPVPITAASKRLIMDCLPRFGWLFETKAGIDGLGA